MLSDIWRACGRSRPGHSFYWEGLQKGKRSIAVDFSSTAGRQLITDLITAPGSDGGILVTNFARGLAGA